MIHLICNAHLDPVWLWEREEGIGEALSTFRIAADFCEKYNEFIFCHNESILYEWVEEYEPALFSRIQKLVKNGHWHIMGGWYLQPDCNMISGESMIRQIQLGRKYFIEKFNKYPEVAINFDPFGHSRGMPQVLAKAGFKAYLFGRPAPRRLKLPGETFTWESLDGSQVVASRLFASYLSLRGEALPKLKKYIKSRGSSNAPGLLAWGIGNHGGGPSKEDLKSLDEFMRDNPDAGVCHSTPEAFFNELEKSRKKLPVFQKDLNPCFTACYTSQIRIKQMHRKLENEISLAEKMCATACVISGGKYPTKELDEAAKDLAFAQFHDILPGSGIAPVEKAALQQMSHGLEKTSRLKTKAFISLINSRKAAEEGEIPLFVWNPHPYPVKTTIECELQLADQNWDDTTTDIHVYDADKKLESQLEKEASNLTLDWRKKVVFSAELAPASIKRFSCIPQKPGKIEEQAFKTSGDLIFDNKDMRIVISRRNGLIKSMIVDGKELLANPAGKIIVMKDDESAWGGRKKKFNSQAGTFKLMSPARIKEVTGFDKKDISPVRIIEDGPVRTIVEALFEYKHSWARIHYIISRSGKDLEINLKVNNQEANRMLKLSVPFADKDAECRAQDVFGSKQIMPTRRETVIQKWAGTVSKKNNNALLVCNDSSYGMDYLSGEMRFSLLRSACYSAMHLSGRNIVPLDRCNDRFDIGEREYKFKLTALNASEFTKAERHCCTFSEPPQKMIFFPGGSESSKNLFFEVSGDTAIISSCRIAEDKQLRIRIFNPAGSKITTKLTINNFNINKQIKLKAFEFQTFAIDTVERTISPVSLME